jgi:hypothetical protein
MSPDFYFALSLIVKMAVTAAFLLAATIVAERAGPLVGGLVATLPISAGPVYFFLALDHDAHFIAQAALGSLATNALNAVFAVAYALLAQQRSLTVSLLGAYAVWLVLSFAIRLVHWDLALALTFNAAIIAVAWWIVQPLRHLRVPPVRARWYDLVTRALMIAVLVGTVVTLSFTIGAISTGNIAVFPIVLTSIAVVLHRRIGGPATAAILANAVIGLGGFGISVATLYLAAERLGAPLALSLALAVSIGCNMMLYVVRKRAATA